jgi:hypothetical protein
VIAGVNRTYHTLSVPDNMISESLLVLIVPKPASGRCAGEECPKVVMDQNQTSARVD